MQGRTAAWGLPVGQRRITPLKASDGSERAIRTGVLPKAGERGRVPRTPHAVRSSGAGGVDLAAAERMGGSTLS